VWRGGVVGGVPWRVWAGAKVLRRIADPVVAGPAAGVRMSHSARYAFEWGEATRLPRSDTDSGSGGIAVSLAVRSAVFARSCGRVAWAGGERNRMPVTWLCSSCGGRGVSLARLTHHFHKKNSKNRLGIRALSAQCYGSLGRGCFLEARCALWPGELAPLTATMGARASIAASRLLSQRG